MITSGNDYDKEEEEYYYYDDYGDEDLYDYADYRLVNFVSMHYMQSTHFLVLGKWVGLHLYDVLVYKAALA